MNNYTFVVALIMLMIVCAMIGYNAGVQDVRKEQRNSGKTE